MRKGWEIKMLGEVCDVSAGGDVPKDAFSEIKTDVYSVPVYANGEKDDGFMGYTNVPKITRPSVTVSARGTIGYAVKRLDCFYPVVRLIVVTPKENCKLDLSYLYYGLAKIDFKHTGTSIPQLTVPMVKLYDIPIPPLPEQQRIVAILDEAFEAIDQAKANTERNLQNARKLFQSELNRIFTNKGEGWVEKKLKDICELKPQKKEARDKLKETDLVTFLPMEELGIESKEIYPTQEKPLKDVSGSYTYFADNDVLLAKITPCFENGKIGIATNLKNGIGFGSSEYIVFRSTGEVEPELLFYFLSRKSFREEGKPLMSGAVGHRRVSKDWIENYLMPFPKSQGEQKIIVNQLDTLSAETKRLEANYQKKLYGLEELKKSILQKAFSGKLTQVKEVYL